MMDTQMLWSFYWAGALLAFLLLVKKFFFNDAGNNFKNLLNNIYKTAPFIALGAVILIIAISSAFSWITVCVLIAKRMEGEKLKEKEDNE